LLEYAILQRFPDLSLKEVQQMIRLTPLEKTVAGQELIELGMKEGVAKGKELGRKEGELIGEIRALHRILKRRQIPKTELAPKSPKELKAILKQLRDEL
jgi:predicted transposase YdaD